jgi:hypothetical protein
MNTLLSGMNTGGFLVAALFFFRFWWRTSDGLFLSFSAAFILFAVNQVLTGLSVTGQENQSLLYLPRVFAFALLIAAIISKNLARNSNRP